MAVRIFQFMKYSNKDFLRVIIIVVGCDPVVNPWVFESTLGGSLVPSPFALSVQASIYL